MIKSFLLPILLIGTAVAAVLMYTLPLYETLQHKQLEQATYENALAQGEEILDLKEELRIQYDSFSPEDRIKLQKMLPDRADTIRAILETDDIAAKNGVVLTAVTDEPTENRTNQASVSRDKFSTIKASYNVSADYESFLLFLKELERSLRITDLSALSFTVASEEGGSSLIDFTLEANSYWLSE